MEIRFHHRRLAWIFAATVIGVAGCAAGKGEAPEGGTTETGAGKPAKPSGTKPNGTTGSTQPGKPKQKHAHRPPRSKVTPGGEVCIPGSQKAPRRTSEMGRPVAFDAICSGIVTRDDVAVDQNISDAQIVSLLAAIDQNDVDAATVAADRVRDSRVRELAQMELLSHARAGDAQSKLTPSGATVADSGLLRLVTDRGAADLTALRQAVGAEINRQYLCRQIVTHERALRILDALEAQVKDAAVRCVLEEERVLDGGHLDFAYWLMGSMTEGHRGYAAFGRGQKVKVKADDMDDEDDDVVADDADEDDAAEEM